MCSCPNHKELMCGTIWTALTVEVNKTLTDLQSFIISLTQGEAFKKKHVDISAPFTIIINIGITSCSVLSGVRDKLANK